MIEFIFQAPSAGSASGVVNAGGPVFGHQDTTAELVDGHDDVVCVTVTDASPEQKAKAVGRGKDPEHPKERIRSFAQKSWPNGWTLLCYGLDAKQTWLG